MGTLCSWVRMRFPACILLAYEIELAHEREGSARNTWVRGDPVNAD